MIRSIISDMGNVLVFFDNNIFFENISPYSRYSPSEIGHLFFANDHLLKQFDLGLITDNEFFRQFKDIMKLNIEKERFFEIYNNIFTFNPVTTEVLRQLKNRYRLILLSNTDSQRFKFILRKFPQLKFFDAYVLSFQVGAVKPEEKIYREALAKASCKPQEAVFIDDREENVTKARALGLKAIHYIPKETDLKKELKELGLAVKE